MQSAKINLRTATRADIPALRENWRLSFGDGEAYLDFFFSRRFEPRLTPVAVADGRLVAQLFLLPALLVSDGDSCEVYYLFAAATHPQYRGLGIMAQLLREAEHIACANGRNAVVLLPGEPGLYLYYARHGYETAFTRRVWTVARSELAEIALESPETDAFLFLLRYLQQREGVCWNEDALRYALDEHRRFRGTYAACESAFAAVSADEADVLCAPSGFQHAAGLLLRLTNSEHLTLRFPSDIPYGTPQDGGMIRWLGEKKLMHNAYISFAME